MTQKSNFNVSNILTQALRDLRRGRAFVVSSLVVLTLCLTVSGVFLLLIFNINRNIEELGGDSEIVLYIDEGNTAPQSLESNILKISGVLSARFVSREEILAEEMQRFSKYPALFAHLSSSENPYRNSFVVSFDKDVDVQGLCNNLLAIPGVAKVVTHIETINEISAFEKGVVFIFTSFGLGLLLVSLFVIFMTVRQAYNARSEEISLMRYVGATKSFICAPFVVEGGIIGFFSGLFAAVISSVLYVSVSSILTKREYNIFVIINPALIIPLTFIVLTICGVLLGTFASFLSVRRYARG